MQTSFHPKNINGDSGIEIPEAWMPTKRHNSSSARRRTERDYILTGTKRIKTDPVTAHNRDTNSDVQQIELIAR